MFVLGLFQAPIGIDFTTVDGVPAHGGPVAAKGALYVGSGTVGVQNGMAGNVLPAFGA